MQDEAARPLIVLMHGDCKVSTKNLARAIPCKSVEPCKPEVAQRHSGYLVGGTSPFGLRKAMPVYVEESILPLPQDLYQRRPARLPGRDRAGRAGRGAEGEGRCIARWRISVLPMRWCIFHAPGQLPKTGVRARF